MYAPSRSTGRAPGVAGRLPLSSKLADYSVFTLAIVLGVGSLVFFAWPGRPVFMPLGLSARTAVWWNALVSCIFFVQHSVLVRRSVRARLAGIVPARYDGAFYAITSGVALAVVTVLLQPAGEPFLVLQGIPRAGLTAAAILAAAGFAWGIRSLRTSDLLGLRPIREHLRGDRGLPSEGAWPSPLVVRGPYRWVRHPLYSCVIVLLWSNPVLSVNHIVFATVWTAWIYVGALLEERDLIADFGEGYRRYRVQVPILIPWRGRVAVQID